MNRRCLFILLALFGAAGTAAAQATSSAAACSGCHAPAADGPVPSLTGRPAAEIVAAMLAFRAGDRDATVMDRIAKGFSDEEIRAIAEWYETGPKHVQP